MAGGPPSFADLLVARADDDHAAILFEDEVISYRELVAAAAARAALLTEARRDGPFHVGVLLENVPEYLYWIAGAALAGAAVVGINPTRRGAELAHDVRHTDCQLVVTDTAGAALLDGLDLGVAAESVLTVGAPAYDARLRAYTGATPPAQLPEPRTRLLLLFTSGSTSAPKAVVCSSGRLAGAGLTTIKMFEVDRDSVLYESMPLFHGNALMANVTTAVTAGATIALRRKFSASGFLPDVRRFGATYFNYVGRALSYILAVPETTEDADNSLRLGFGTEASALDRQRFEARFGCRLIENYGSSEGVIAIVRMPGCPEQALGKPRPGEGADVAVMDPASGQECTAALFDEHGRLLNGDEAIGELVRRDRGARFEGYYNNEEATAERVRDGWYWSGDLAYRDADGWFYFAGRSADRLRVDSENFAAAPIEGILSRLPGVVMVAVYPVPDARTGDQVMAALELGPGAEFDADAFAEFLAAQEDLGTKWAPRYVRIIEHMPLTANNKVNKQPLRAVRWETDDPVWVRDAADGPYRRMTDADAAGLRADFETHARSHVLQAGG
ncbi:MAG TPA: AMP-binding protein [Acidimicrobiia bacterium]|nr:AMP-binding protein [Acidimicrobiia bacterium]